MVIIQMSQITCGQEEEQDTSSSAMSRFSNIGFAPSCEHAKVMERYENDMYPTKLNLANSPFLSDNGSVIVHPAVQIVQGIILNDDTLNKQFVPTLGLEAFTRLATAIILGKESRAAVEGRAFSVQVIAGTGGSRVAAETFKSIFGYTTVYFSQETRDTKTLMFHVTGLDVREYRYIHESRFEIDFFAFKEDLYSAPERSVFHLYACGHSPTGLDFSKEQWKVIAGIMKERNLVPFFDCAYLGLVSGDMEVDAWPVRYFASLDIPLVCTQSFSVTFCIYSERVGNLVFVVQDAHELPMIKFGVSSIISAIHSNPPCFGARILAFIFNNRSLYDLSKDFIQGMAERLAKTRRSIREQLERLATPGDLSFITNQRGLFLYLRFSARQVDYLARKYHIHSYEKSIDLSGVTLQNMEYIVKALSDTILRGGTGLEPKCVKVCDHNVDVSFISI